MKSGLGRTGIGKRAALGVLMATLALLIGGCPQPGNTPPARYTITFDSQGGSTVDALAGEEGAAVSQPVNPTKAEYTFTGWFNAASGGTVYAWPHTLTADITMYAQWRKVLSPEEQAAVDGFTGNETVQTALAQEIGEIDLELPLTDLAAVEAAIEAALAAYEALPEAAKEVLAGEKTKLEAVKAKVENVDTAHTFLTAHEEVLGRDPDAVMDPAEAEALLTAVDAALAELEALLDGAKELLAETRERLESLQAKAEEAAGADGEERYNISYELNGGSNAGTNPSVYRERNLPLSLAAPARTGYAFAGWYDNAALSGSAVTAIPVGAAENKTFYARWTAISYTAAYDKNADDASGTTGPSAHTYDEAKALTANGFTRTGYTFAGWNTQASGGGAGYTNGQSVVNLSSTNGATVTLYAQWTAISYTVAYDKNADDASGTTGSSTHTYDEAKALTANGFTWTGYSFEGWNTQADGGGAGYTDGQSVVNLSSANGATVTLYARWTPWTAVPYTITYHLNGGTNHSENPASYTIESPAITLEEPSRDGYTFGGWYDNPALSGPAVTTIPAASTGDKAFYAKWNPGVSLGITLGTQPEDPPLSSVSLFVDQETSFSATGSGYTSWQWYWNGEAIIDADADTYTLAANTRSPGVYELSVEVRTGGGTRLSAQCWVTIKAR